jgi:hypothetical protein
MGVKSRFLFSLVLQSHLKGSSRGQERSLRRKQDVQNAYPQTLFQPALIATGLYWLLRTSVRKIDSLVFHHNPIFLCHVILNPWKK